MRGSGRLRMIGALAAAGAGLGAPAAATAQGGGEAAEVIVRQGTHLAATASPDGRRLLIDLQGVLWRVPPEGGRARRITDDLDDPALPDWAPDGRSVVFQTYRRGTFDVWTMRPDGSRQRPLTSGPADDREPVHSPDGTRIAFSSDRAGSYDVWVLDLRTQALTRWTSAPGEEFEPTWSPDGREIAYVAATPADDPERRIGEQTTLDAHTIEATDGTGAVREVLSEEEGTIHSPSWAPAGERIAYVLADGVRSDLKVSGERITRGEDVFPFRPDWVGEDELIYTGDGRVRRRALGAGEAATIPFRATLAFDREAYRFQGRAFDSRRRRPVRGIVGPVLSPDASRIAFVALNDLWLMRIGERPRRLTRDGFLETGAAFSPDGERLAYSSDRGGSEDLYVRDLRTGEEERVTRAPGAEVEAAFSPDGAQLAFQDQVGATSVVDLASGEVREVIAAAWEPGPPTWGPGGRTLAIAALDPVTDRFREGASMVLLTDAATGARRFTEPVPGVSLSNRVNSGPVWSPAGDRMAVVVESRLWSVPVDETGTPTGAAERITDEIAESPSFSGDGSKILYQSGTRLRLADADGSEPRTLDVRLRWRRAAPPRETVVHAGRLWDGVRRRARRNVDIVIRDGRIARIERHRPGREAVDASKLTVLPGLIDSHVHQELYNGFLGDRQGRQQLAFGVTSTVSVGDPAYEALEDREALASGARVGPRFFASGEPIDGSRVYYDFMRPTTDSASMRRELRRVGALDYDVFKTYVRLPYDRQAAGIDFAHRLGLPAFSHYFWPPIALGQDGISHITATQRLGFSRTQSMTGVGYHDVIRLAAASDMSMTSTLFGALTLLALDPSLVEDPRVRTLYAPWQRETLEEDLEAAQTEPQGTARTLLRRSVDILRRIHRAGGVVLVGTDVPLEPLGLHQHLNLRAMVRYGFTPWEALRTATAIPARHLGLARDLGTVRPGRLADLVMVEGDPLERIEDLAKVRIVMRGGRAETVAELMRPFDD